MPNPSHASYRVFWGDTHQNTYTSEHPEVPIAQTLAFAAAHLDFYTGAYYTPVMTRVPARADRVNTALGPTPGHIGDRMPSVQVWTGIHNEGTKPSARIAAEWAEFEAALEAAHVPGRFVSFPGYE
jgi:hypothetical protein